MSKKIYGIPVSTPINPAKVDPVVPDEKIAPAVAEYMERHPITPNSIGARPDTWLPTIAEIGAAPAGYGLGTTPKYITDANEATVPGFYAPNGVSCANIPSEWQFLYGTIIVSQGASFIEQLFLASNLMAKRTCDPHGSGWGEWEYINPPMVPNKEYRTTERWNGLAVYTKLVSNGTVGTGNTQVYWNFSKTPTHIVRTAAKISTATLGDITLPFIYGDMSSSYTAVCAPCRDSILFVCGANVTGQAYAQVWYTLD